jgi:hypothetical protein
MFADSPIFRALSIGVRIGDPALPLFRRDANLPPDAARLLRHHELRGLPDALARPESPNVRLWTVRFAIAATVGAFVGLLLARR